MEFGSIEREIYVDAPPEVVFEVVSAPAHVQEWWADEADYEVVTGATGKLVFGERGVDAKVLRFTVVEVQPPRLFSLRWTHPPGQPAAAGNSLLVTFDLSAAGDGTLLKMTETGFREMGWELAKLEREYTAHVTGWNRYVPRIPAYAASVRASA